MALHFLVAIAGTFARLISLRNNGMNIDTMITTYNIAGIDSISETLGKERHRKRYLVTRDGIEVCDKRRGGMKQKERLS